MSSDTSSIIGATENPPDVNGLPSNFLSIMDITQHRSNTRGRKTGGQTIYTCTRVPFSAIECDEFKQLPVAYNPYIKDSLIASRRTMVRYIAANYDFYSSKIKDSLTTASRRRIRCIAHIINLSLQAFLLASSKEALFAALESASGITGEELLSQFSEVLASHRKKAATRLNTAKRKNGEPARKHKRKGTTASNASVILADDFSGVENVPALRELHGLAVRLSSSSLHQNLWDKAVGLRLGIGTRTCWSSWYQVIDRANTKKDKIQSFMSDHEEAIGDNRLLVGD
ncbi:hypothetical protein QWA68_013742 [Fusarium oxysporum]|nr:hypothetical protein QWA68_013742 [Fusarium oxysporum]